MVKDPKGRVAMSFPASCVSLHVHSKAIRIQPVEIDGKERADRASHRKSEPSAFDINMLRCIYCGLCFKKFALRRLSFCKMNFRSLRYSRGRNGIRQGSVTQELGGTLP